MKASEFIGMKVLNKEANDVGKIADIAINLKKCHLDKIIIVEGGTLSKKYFAVTEEDLAEIGDYVQLKLGKEEMNQIEKKDKVEDLMGDESHFKDYVGKIVISEDALNVGKIEDMIIEPKECLIHQVVVSTGGTFNKKQLIISDADINHIGDYVLLKINKEGLKEKTVD
jgi:sporulation protein YlmC with PRC-barrel domain